MVIMLAALFILLGSAGMTALDAGQNTARSFSDEDLDRYKEDASSEEPVQNNTEPEEQVKADRPLRRYVVPYSGGSRRIIIPVTFNGRVTANMLLDTGAPGMHISTGLAEALGLIENKESNLWVTIGGIGGSAPAIFTIMDSIRVGDSEDHFIPTFISQSVSGEFEGLIGMDFMANYEVRIDTKKRVVIFEEMPQNSDTPAGHDERWWRTTFHQIRSMRATLESYRKKIFRAEAYTDRERELSELIDKQYRKADEFFNRLSGYASQHSVPNEWR